MISQLIRKNKTRLILPVAFLALFFLGLILSVSIGKYQPYSMVYLPLGITVLILSFLFIALILFAKDRKAKNFKLKFLTKISCRLAEKENRIRFILSLLPIIGFLIFFARFYFYKNNVSYLVEGNQYYYKYYDYLNLQSYLVSDKLYDLLTMSHLERSVSAILNDWIVALTVSSIVCAFYLGDLSVSFRRYIMTPVAGLITILLPLCTLGIVGTEVDYRLYLMGAEVALLDFYSFTSYLDEKPLSCNKAQVRKLIVLAVPFFLTSMSSYTPSLILGGSLFGLTNPHEPSDLSHRLFIYLAFLLPVYYYMTLSGLSDKEKKSALIQISLGTFLGYISINRYDIWLDFTSWPLHLCNTAMYTMPLTLLYKNYGVYYFTFFINVLGAFLALLMPNFSTSLPVFHPTAIHFYINHLYAFFMPVLIALLGVYERPKMKYFIYSQLGFFVYFAFVMFINVYLTAHGKQSDFFFINSDFVAGKLGKWAKDLFANSVKFTIGEYNYEIHLLYDIIYYLVYIVLAFGMWFVYELLFRVTDELVLLVGAKRQYRIRHTEFSNYEKKGETHMENDNGISLNVSHLYKKYHGAENYTVEDFSMNLTGGKIYGFLGKNGAGKSTIIKSIVGIHGFEKGIIEICGHNVTEEAMEAKKDTGFVPDNYALYENLTGRQYIGYIADLFEVEKSVRKEREDDLVKRLELTARYDKPMKTYSHGMKQKITIIAALIHEPKVWILDEPMTGLDPNSIYQIKECMRQHAKKGNIVFFSSHIIDVVKTLCDDVIIIKHGKLVEEIDLNEHPERRDTLEKDFLLLTSDNEEEAKALLLEESKGQIL